MRCFAISDLVVKNVPSNLSVKVKVVESSHQSNGGNLKKGTFIYP